MKKLLFFVLLLPFLGKAQILSIDSSSVNFGITMVGDTDSSMITIRNTSSNAVQVNNIKFYSIYSDFPFSTAQNQFSIPANGTQSIWVYFTPTQNILHSSTMVVQHNETSGHEAISLTGQGRFPLTYYNSTENLTEEALKTALKTRLGQGYTQLSYNAARNEMFDDFDNKRFNGQGATTNTIECVYTGYNKTGYSSRSDAQNTSPQFNTEHTFPQGFFNQSLPMRSDIHHLFPTTNNSNSQRGNKPFGVVTNGTAVTLGGGSFYNNNTFEPRNEQKGKTARAMMYFVIRYQDYSNHFSSQQNILKTWHNTYPVDSIETQRNNDIFTVQNNRNPFVDYPQLEERITNFIATSTAPTQFGLDILQTAIDFGNYTVSQSDTFDYVIVNRGNQTLNISNLAVSNTTFLSLKGGGANASILPGEFLEIGVIVNSSSSGTLNETLTFDTNIPGSQSSFAIPIRGNALAVGLVENNLESTLKVYPNPMNDKLYIRMDGEHQLDIRILDILGKEVDLDFLKIDNGSATISTEELTKGLYFLQIKEGNNTLVKKLVK